MRMPEFWSIGQARLWPRLLAPLGALYGAITIARLKKPGWSAPIPVLCVGNFVLGGAGKTPTALALALNLSALGESPFILTRGYGGRLKGPLKVDPQIHCARDVGDEPLLLALSAPVIVAKNRVLGAQHAIDLGASVLILDDGMQSPALQKDFTLAVMDAGFGLGNGQVFPAGPLRAPMAALEGRFDSLLLIGACNPDLPKTKAPLYRATLEIDETIKSQLRGATLTAFAGIGRPEKFAQSLKEAGAKVESLMSFPDHHAFSEADAKRLLALVGAGKTLVTTQKDAMRLSGSPALDRLNESVTVVPVFLPLPTPLIQQVQDVLATFRSRSSTASGPA
jgi:tetraacyldisaccharide 4'-kinase